MSPPSKPSGDPSGPGDQRPSSRAVEAGGRRQRTSTAGEPDTWCLLHSAPLLTQVAGKEAAVVGLEPLLLLPRCPGSLTWRKDGKRIPPPRLIPISVRPQSADTFETLYLRVVRPEAASLPLGSMPTTCCCCSVPRMKSCRRRPGDGRSPETN